MSPPTGPAPEAAPEDVGERDREPWHLRDHIGIVSGLLLGLIALGVLVLLAAAGDPGAIGILVVLVIGIALIYFGAQLHGARRR